MKRRSTQKINIWILGLILFCSGCATGEKYTISDDLNEATASGSIVVEMKEVALAIGKIKGEGLLTFKGEEHFFTMSGFDYGSFSKFTIKTYGNVFHLDNLSDFEGIYFSGKAGLSVGSTGKVGLFLINKRGVTIHLTSEEEKGFDLSLGRGGIKIKFKK